jgi:hypothetical protein
MQDLKAIALAVRGRGVAASQTDPELTRQYLAKTLKEAQAAEHAGDIALKLYTECESLECDVIVRESNGQPISICNNHPNSAKD